MNPMTRLLIAAAAFLATHYIASTPLRPRLARILGANGYLLLYSAVAFVTLGAMVWAYYRAPFIGVWYLPALRYAPAIAMPFALMLIACGLLMRNPSAVGGERLLRDPEAARGILRITRHPVMWGIALWAASHMLARGDAGALVFFGTFLLLALSGTVLIDRRKRSGLGRNWQRYAAATSNVPFVAIANGSNRFHAAEIGASRTAVAIALYVLLWWAHPLLFGAAPY
jgi:uncharacterized membrane protein